MMRRYLKVIVITLLGLAIIVAVLRNRSKKITYSDYGSAFNHSEEVVEYYNMPEYIFKSNGLADENGDITLQAYEIALSYGISHLAIKNEAIDINKRLFYNKHDIKLMEMIYSSLLNSSDIAVAYVTKYREFGIREDSIELPDLGVKDGDNYYLVRYRSDYWNKFNITDGEVMSLREAISEIKGSKESEFNREVYLMYKNLYKYIRDNSITDDIYKLKPEGNAAE